MSEKTRSLFAQRPLLVSPVPKLAGTNATPSETDIPKIKEALALADARRSTIVADLARIEAAIKALTTEREAVERFSDAHRMLIAPSRRLVPDIWGEVFQWAVFMDRDELLGARGSAPLLLTHVCQSWREIALMPSLWSFVNVQFRTPPHWLEEFPVVVGSKLEIVNLWLRRSANLRLHIRAGGSHFQLASIVEALVKHCERWETVTLGLSALSFQESERLMGPVRGRTAGLRKLSFEPRKHHSLEIWESETIRTFQSAPNLRELEMVGWRLDTAPSDVHLPRLRFLSVSDNGSFDWSTALDMPELEELSLNGTPWRKGGRSSVILPRLRRLKLGSSAWLGETVGLPSLHSLELEGCCEHPSLDTPILDFHVRCGHPHIQSLTIQGFEGYLSFDLLESLSHLTFLSLQGNIQHRLLAALTVPRHTSGLEYILPDLETLELRGTIVPNALDVEDETLPARFFAVMVQSRWEIPRRSLRKVLLHYNGMWADSHFPAWVADLKGEGLILDIDIAPVITIPRTPPGIRRMLELSSDSEEWDSSSDSETRGRQMSRSPKVVGSGSLSPLSSMGSDFGLNKFSFGNSAVRALSLSSGGGN